MKWYKTKEKLPHDNKLILAQTDDTLYTLCFYNESKNYFYKTDNNGEEHKITCNVIYWTNIESPTRENVWSLDYLPEEGSTRFNIEVLMQNRWIPWFCKFLEEMEYCGNIGHSSLLGFYSDGDGDFRPKFNIGIIFNDARIKPSKNVRTSMIEKVYDAG